MEVYKDFWKNYFNTSGTATRRDMWMVLLFHFIRLIHNNY